MGCQTEEEIFDPGYEPDWAVISTVGTRARAQEETNGNQKDDGDVCPLVYLSGIVQGLLVKMQQGIKDGGRGEEVAGKCGIYFSGSLDIIPFIFVLGFPLSSSFRAQISSPTWSVGLLPQLV